MSLTASLGSDWCLTHEEKQVKYINIRRTYLSATSESTGAKGCGGGSLTLHITGSYISPVDEGDIVVVVFIELGRVLEIPAKKS